MHICHEEILGLLAAIPFLGVLVMKAKRFWHRIFTFCIHKAWGGNDKILPGWNIERTTKENWFVGYRPFFYDAPFYCFGFGFFQIYYYGFPFFYSFLGDRITLWMENVGFLYIGKR